MEKRSFLHAKTRIGQGERISFGSYQTVFRKEDLDEKVRSRHDDVRNFARGEKYSVHKSWNNSTHVEKPVFESKKMENFVRDRSNPYQYNYRAETVGPKLAPPEEKPHKFHVTLKKTTVPGLSETKQKKPLYDENCQTLKRTQEMPVHPNLSQSFSAEWNCSTEYDQKGSNNHYEQITDKAKRNSERKKNLVNPDKYKGPLQRSKEIAQTVRKQKQTGTFSVEKPVVKVEEEKVNRKALVNRYAVEPDLSFVTTKHSGVWEKQPDGRYMWSDTGSYVYDSPGDIIIRHNPDHYNYAKPTLSKPK